MPALAKLSQLKSLLDTTETAQDALLLQLLEEATAAAALEMGRDSILRQQGIVEYSASFRNQCKFIRLRHYPVESVASVKQLFMAGTDADFDAETSLVQNDDYVLAAEFGVLERTHTHWTTGPRYIQAVYTGGFVDPARVKIELTTATWAASTKTLTETGAFASYTHSPGDVIVVTGGTGAELGMYRIAGKTDNDSVTLEESLSATNLATGDIASGYQGMILPPRSLQKGILSEAVRLWHTRASNGLNNVDFGRGGSVSINPNETDPTLVKAARALRHLV